MDRLNYGHSGQTILSPNYKDKPQRSDGFGTGSKSEKLKPQIGDDPDDEIDFHVGSEKFDDRFKLIKPPGWKEFDPQDKDGRKLEEIPWNQMTQRQKDEVSRREVCRAEEAKEYKDQMERMGFRV